MTSEQLFYDKKTGFDRLTEADRQGIQTYAEGYKTFLDEAKTERDAVKEIARMAEAKGFRAWTRDDTLKTGDKIYRINRHKGIMLAVIGEKSLAEGVRLTAAHLDAPRVDIRTVPLYEDNGMAFSRPITTAALKSISGLPFRSSCAALSASATRARSSASRSAWATSRATRNSSSPTFFPISPQIR